MAVASYDSPTNKNLNIPPVIKIFSDKLTTIKQVRIRIYPFLSINHWDIFLFLYFVRLQLKFGVQSNSTKMVPVSTNWRILSSVRAVPLVNINELTPYFLLFIMLNHPLYSRIFITERRMLVLFHDGTLRRLTSKYVCLMRLFYQLEYLVAYLPVVQCFIQVCQYFPTRANQTTANSKSTPLGTQEQWNGDNLSPVISVRRN